MLYKTKKYELTQKANFLSAFRYKNLIFYGGGVDDLALSAPWDFIIKLDGYSSIPLPKISVPVIFKSLAKLLEDLKNVPVLEINCADGSVPSLSVSAWAALVKDLKQINKASLKDVEIAVCCRAGHGRTGTVLAILKSLLLNEKGDPVESIRASYLDEAVETTRQITYVEFITGKKVSVPSSYSAKSKTSGYLSTSYKKEEYYEKDYLGQVYVKPGDSIAQVATKISDALKPSYPVHKKEDCVGKNCPDKDSPWQIHCAKKSATKEGVKPMIVTTT